MGLWQFITGIVVQDPFSSCLSKVAEGFGEKISRVIEDAALSKKMSNCFDECAKDVVKIYDEKHLDKTLKKAYEAFNKETNLYKRMPTFFQAVYNDIPDDGNKIYRFMHTTEICSNTYTAIMQTMDKDGGDKLKEQFKEAKDVYSECCLKAVKNASSQPFDDDYIYTSIVFAFENDKPLSGQTTAKLAEYFSDSSIYDYEIDLLGNTVTLDLRDNEEGETGAEAKATCQIVKEILSNDIDISKIYVAGHYDPELMAI